MEMAAKVDDPSLIPFTSSRYLRFWILVFGILFFFGCHNYMQELIMSLPGFKVSSCAYGMYVSWFLSQVGVFLGYLEVLGVAVCSFVERKVQGETTRRAPWSSYFMLCFCLLISSATSNIALNYINYPTKVVFRSCKVCLLHCEIAHRNAFAYGANFLADSNNGYCGYLQQEESALVWIYVWNFHIGWNGVFRSGWLPSLPQIWFHRWDTLFLNWGLILINHFWQALHWCPSVSLQMLSFPIFKNVCSSMGPHESKWLSLRTFFALRPCLDLSHSLATFKKLSLTPLQILMRSRWWSSTHFWPILPSLFTWLW